MKKLTKLLTTTLLALSLCFALGLCFSYGNTVHAENTTGWVNNAGQLSFYYKSKAGTEKKAVNVSVKFSSETSIEANGIQYKFRPGTYTFNASGNLVIDSTTIRETRILIIVNSSFQETSDSGIYYLFTKKGTTITKNGSVWTYSPISGFFTGDKGGKVYYNGKAYASGYALKSNGYMYTVKNGAYQKKYTGLLTKAYVNTKISTYASAPNKYYKNGSLFTGIANKKYYVNGVFNKKTGWLNWNSARYYLKSGKAVTGWKYLKDYSKSSTKYKYYFKKDGKLVTDLFKQFGSSYKKKRMKIRLNLTTHNITFYLYDYAKKQYIIPAKTVVCSTARDGKSTYVGNHYLAKSTARRWFIYKKSKPWHFYQWGVWVHGTKSWIHSEMYRSTNNRRLIADTYNGLGTNQTTACIRVQAGNAKLVYDIAKSNPYRVYVQIYRSSNRGPFGKVTLSSTTGKISKKQTYDPTDPAFS